MHSLETIPDGNPGLQVKLAKLRGLVNRDRANPKMIALARSLVAHVPERDWRGEINAVSGYTRKIRYTMDPVGVEAFTQPIALAASINNGKAYGDCDDHVGLTATLLECLGHPTRFRVGGNGVRGDEAWSHIWLDVDERGKGWRPVDDTAKTMATGFDPSPAFAVAASERREVGSMSMATMMRRAVVTDRRASTSRGRAGFYGGSSPAQDFAGLGNLGFGFKSITHALKQVAAPIVKVQKAFFVDLPKKVISTQLKIIKSVAPVAAPIAANILAPGSGAIVSQFFQDPLMPNNPNNASQLPPPQVQPAAPYPPYSQGAFFDGGGGSAGGDGYGGGFTQRQGQLPSWVLPVGGVAVAGLVVFLLMHKKGRRR